MHLLFACRNTDKDHQLSWEERSSSLVGTKIIISRGEDEQGSASQGKLPKDTGTHRL